MIERVSPLLPLSLDPYLSRPKITIQVITHYRKGAEVEKDISLKNLRKTYLTWVNQVMSTDTKILSSYPTNGLLKEFYLDPKILSPIEEGSIKIKIFG